MGGGESPSPLKILNISTTAIRTYVHSFVRTYVHSTHKFLGAERERYRCLHACNRRYYYYIFTVGILALQSELLLAVVVAAAVLSTPIIPITICFTRVPFFCNNMLRFISDMSATRHYLPSSTTSAAIYTFLHSAHPFSCLSPPPPYPPCPPPHLSPLLNRPKVARLLLLPLLLLHLTKTKTHKGEKIKTTTQSMAQYNWYLI